MLRSPGSIIFGIASDRYGRKWPFVVNCILFIVLELGTGFTQTYPQFLACRALFGVAMGGLYGVLTPFDFVFRSWFYQVPYLGPANTDLK